MTSLNVGANPFVPKPLGSTPAQPAKVAGLQHASISQEAGPGEHDDGGANDLLEYLASVYPQYSTQALRLIFEAEEGNLYATLDALAELEGELVGQLPPVPARRPVSAPVPPSNRGFPALGDGNEAVKPEARAPAAGSWAARAAAAAPRARAPGGPRADGPTAARPLGSLPRDGPSSRAAAPIWASNGAVPQVNSGAAVQREYDTTRATASDLSRLRNQYFMQATQAYLGGNKALAKELSAAGHQAAEAMRAAHRQAAASTFQTRNAALASRDGEATVDLHGLHVSEAMDVVRSEIAAREGVRGVTLRLVVGEGRHSAGKKGRLRSAIRSLLDELRVNWSEPYAGLLSVQF